MRIVRLEREDDIDGWRAAARPLAAARQPAASILWQVGETATDLFAVAPTPSGSAPPAPPTAPLSVPREFLSLAQGVILHRNPQRFSLLYALLLRVVDAPRILQDRADPQISLLRQMQQAVGRDIHKMHAFLRFREVADGPSHRFVAWFEPEHHILRATAGFFINRFTTLHWSILTPGGSLHWDTRTLREGPPAERADAPGKDPIETIWKHYYAATFNPARVNPRAMLKEMPKKYWHALPEAALIPGLIGSAHRREQEMLAAGSTPPIFNRNIS